MRRSKRHARLRNFVKDVSTHTPFMKMVVLLVVLWMVFSAGLYMAERGEDGTTITSYGRSLYWGIAAFSTAGIADTPRTDLGQVIGGIWIVVGSVLFFGTIVATVTTYFMRPMQHPAKRIIDMIEYNLEQMDDLTIEELDLLKKTVDSLILHVEKVKKKKEKDNEK